MIRVTVDLGERADETDLRALVLYALRCNPTMIAVDLDHVQHPTEPQGGET